MMSQNLQEALLNTFKSLSFVSALILLASCSVFDKYKTPTTGSKASSASKASSTKYMDPNAVSGPTTGHSYYTGPSSTPKMEKKKSAANKAATSTKKKSTTTTGKKTL